MKKILSFLLAATLCVSLCACSAGDELFAKYADLIYLLEDGKYEDAIAMIEDMRPETQLKDPTDPAPTEPGSDETDPSNPTDPPSAPSEPVPADPTEPPTDPTVPEGQPVYISTAEQLFAIDTKADTTYILINNIDLAGWEQTLSEFHGVLEGGGFTLSNAVRPLVQINYGTIQNLTMADCSIHLEDKAAAIAVENCGTISRCAVTGEISSVTLSAYAAGVAAWNQQEGVVESCVNHAAIYTRSYALNEIGNELHGTWSVAGGLVAMNYGSVERCWNTGDIKAEDADYSSDAGGITAMNERDGTVNDCGNTGTIFAAEFWNNSVLQGNEGGISGYNIGRITTCVNFGIARAGLVYDNRNYLIDSYYLEGVSEKGGDDETWERIASFSADQLTDESVFVGFDFESIWIITENGPALR